jgi:acyl-coenzyme A synthetase/AMP-(fatty) acid ligase
MVGVWLAGGVHVPVNPRLPESEVAAILDTTRPAALVTSEGTRTLDDPAPYEDDVAFVMWTSGTTGRPTPVHHTHTAYVELLDRVLTPLRGGGGGGRPPAPNLIPVSMALNAGLYNALFGLRAGAALVIMDRFEPGLFAALVGRFAIRSTVLPPAAMAMLTDSDVTDLAPLRYVRSITAPLSPLQARRFAAKFPVYVLNGYGQAEIGEVIGWTAADAKAHPNKVGAVGRPHKGVDIRIADDGRLLVRPPNTAVGIAERTDAEGFVDTGDLARIDADRFVYLVGRAKDLIIRGGHNIDPAIVKAALLAHPQVTAANAVGRPDVHAGEVPVAYVTLAPGATVTEDELRDWASRRVPDRTAAPKTVTILDALPLTAVGKPYKPALRTDATRRELRAALDTLAGVHDVEANLEGSSIVAVVHVSASADQAAIKAILGRCAIESRLKVTS